MADTGKDLLGFIKQQAHLYERIDELPEPYQELARGYPQACANLLKMGRLYEARPLTRGEAAYVRRLRITPERYPAKFCFVNAQRLVKRSGGRLRYVEGFATRCHRASVPLHHGWATFNGAVIDPTWRVLGTFSPPAAYFGVEIP